MRVVVFDFDKTLTYKDSLSQLLLWRMRKWPYMLFFPIYCGLKILAKFKIISIRDEKEWSIKYLCPKSIMDFDAMCCNFALQVKLNSIADILQHEVEKGSRVILLSASPVNYLCHLFPNVEIIATTFRLDSSLNIISIDQHPYGKNKLKYLLEKGVSHIDSMYYDSKSDEVLIPLCKEWNLVRSGRIIKQEFRFK